MKKNIKICMIILIMFILSFALFACEDENQSDGSKDKELLTGPEDLCVGERFELVFPDGVNKEDYNIEVITESEIILKNYVITGKEEGTASLEVTLPSGKKQYLMFEVLPEVKPTSVEFSIDKGSDESFMIGKVYKLNCVCYPERSRQEFTFSVGSTKNVIDEENMTITFGEAGSFDIICYAKKSREAKQILKVEVNFNPDVEMYQVLYIGNSFTNYTYNIPSIIKKLMDANGILFNYTIDAPSGFWIADHSDDYFDLVDKNRYTHIVFQEQSKGTITDYDKFETTIKEFSSYVKYKDTKFVMYETWAYERNYMGGEENQKQMMEQLRDAYVAVGNEIGASIARVGEAFFAYQKRSYVDGVETLPTLYAPNDVSHPSYYGAFLSACVHYITLTGRSAKANSFVPTEIDIQYVNLIKEIADEVMGIK